MSTFERMHAVLTAPPGSYMYQPMDKPVLKAAYDVYVKVKRHPEALYVALRMDDIEVSALRGRGPGLLANCKTDL